MRTDICRIAPKVEIGTQLEICNDLDFVCVNSEKPRYVFFFVSDVKINQLRSRQPEIL